MNRDYSIKSAITVGSQKLILQGIACQCGDGSRSGVTTNQKKKKKGRQPLEPGKDMAGVSPGASRAVGPCLTPQV